MWNYSLIELNGGSIPYLNKCGTIPYLNKDLIIHISNKDRITPYLYKIPHLIPFETPSFPQAIELFNISDKDVKLYSNVAMQSETKRAFKVILPGFVQIHLPWFFSQDEVMYDTLLIDMGKTEC